MTEVNSRKFYQFLAGFQQNGKNWVDVADSNYGNGDGTVIKSEFRKFMNAEWNGEENGELTNDLINSFWKKIDTNTSASKIAGTKLKNLNALDKTEVANLDKQLEVYVAFDEFVANNVKIPNVLATTGSQWKSDVTEQLSAKLEQYIAGGYSGDLNTILAEAYPQIANTCTAQYCAVEYQTSLIGSVLKEYPDYKVADDTTLQSLITAYISTIDADTEPNSIKEEIMSIMDAYLATAGLGEGDASLLETMDLGYDKSKVNDIQKVVVKQKLNNQIEAQMDNILKAIFPNITLDGDKKTEFVEILKTLLATAQDDFINTLTVSDISKSVTVSLSGKSSASGSNLVFNPLDYVTDEIKAPVVVEYYSTKLSSMIDSFAEELVAGIENNEGTFAVYDSSKGKIQLDRDTAKTLVNELNKVAKEFITTYVKEGKDLSKIESALKTFIQDNLSGAGNKSVKSGFESLETKYGVFISDSELPDYKKDCIEKLADFFKYNTSAKLGSQTITKDNYESIVNAYTDGNQLYDDIQTLVEAIDTSNKLYDMSDKVKEDLEKAKAEENKAKLSPAAKTIADTIPDIINKKLAAIINGNASLHTEFGLDKDGNIVFQEKDTTESTYNLLKTTIKDSLNSTEEGKSALEAIGGETVLNKLIQAAWIQAYNTYNSSQKNSAAAFITQVLNNFQSIMSSIEKNPEYLKIYTMHTSYTDTSLTNGLIHYNTNTTDGGDETVYYGGKRTIDSNGVVHLKNSANDTDYQTTMNALLTRLIEKYSSLSSDVVTSLFRQAQQKALAICDDGNICDCPYGTGNNKSRVEDSDENKNWKGKDSRKGDKDYIHMDELVQLTLYCFDKLLYAKLAGA